MSKRCLSVTDLQTEIDAGITWRRRELSVLNSLLERSEGKKQDALIRSFIPLLYAHWEGFVKQSCTDYIHFVSMQSLKYEELKSVFITLKMKNIIENYRKRSDFEQSAIALEYLMTNLSTRSYIPYKSIIDTKSNLTYDVFTNILYVLAIDKNKFESDKQLINDLVELRNYIAHGERNTLKIDRCNELYLNIDDLINKLKDQILDSALNEMYKRV